MKRSLFVVALACVSGCTTDQIARAVYYTVRVQNQAVELSLPGQPRDEPMPFDQYQRERRGDASR
jgi:hypothetical protein